MDFMQFCCMAVFLHRKLRYRNIYLAGLWIIVFSLPVSHFGISVGTFIILGIWLLEGDYKKKKNILASHPGILIFASIFLLCLAGLLNTSDFSYAWRDIVIKLPILVLPVLIGTSAPISPKEFRIVFSGLLVGLWITSLTGLAALMGYLNFPVQDVRDISLFISHIRLALLLGLSLHILLYLLLNSRPLPTTEKTGYLISMLWFIFFLFILKAGTSFFMLVLFALVLFIFLIKSIKSFILKYFVIILGITIVLLAVTWLNHAIGRFYARDPLQEPVQAERTVNGNPYDKPVNLTDTENGHYVWLHVCEKELRKAWNSHSKLDYNGRDLRGQELRRTLIRYMTSKNLPKDSTGFARMSPEDIHNVENGMANYLYTYRVALYPYFYQVLWEMNQYKKGKLSGHSHIQRLEYLKTGWQIARDHFWFGVGTGDVPDMYNTYYEKNHSSLTPDWRLRTHNQYLTYWLTYGIFGFMWFLFSFFSPFFFEKKQHNYPAVIFLIIAAMSMLYEDTLETQVGVYFVVFFYSLLIFGIKKQTITK